MARNLPERNGYRFIGSSSLHIHEDQLASLRIVHMPASVGEVAIFAKYEIVVVSPLQISPPLFITPPVDCPQQVRFLLLFERKAARA